MCMYHVVYGTCIYLSKIVDFKLHIVSFNLLCLGLRQLNSLDYIPLFM